MVGVQLAGQGRFTHGGVVPQLEAVLRERLRDGQWVAGEKVPSESALATELGVGRSSVREAVRLLARDGLLEVRHGAGTFVAGARRETDAGVLLRRARLIEVYEVRRALEVEAARLAAHRAGPGELSGLREQLRHRAAAALDPARFVDLDLDFHEAVVALAGNSVLLELFRVARPLIQAALTDRIAADGHLPDTGCAHEDLVDALAAADPAAAVAATERNLAAVLGETAARRS